MKKSIDIIEMIVYNLNIKIKNKGVREMNKIAETRMAVHTHTHVIY